MIISKTPLRASFFGGGTDFEEYYRKSRYGYGSVISTALDMHVYITVNKRFDSMIRVVYSGNELVESVNDVRHNIIREALKITGITEGIEVVYMADLPMTNLGVGLASSSALAVGVLNALHAYKGEYVTAEQLAREACDIEINRLGQQIGKQDQFAVAFGGFNRYFFNADETVTVLPMLCGNDIKEKLVERVMLFYTGSPRDSRQIFREQKKKINDNTAMLDLLVQATETAQKALQEGNLNVWGDLLNETWQIKKKFASGVSNYEIDHMYKAAMDNGALGGKILGAGGGGFLLIYAEPSRHEAVREALKHYKSIDFKMDAQGSRIIFSDGGR